LRLLAVAIGSQLDIVAVGALPDADGQPSLGIVAKLARSDEVGSRLAVAVDMLERKGPRHLALGIVRAPDEPAVAPKLDAEPASAAGGAGTGIGAVGLRREEVGPERLIERRHHLHASQILGTVDRGGEVSPEILQHLFPVGTAAGYVVELVLEVGREVVLDVAQEELGEEGSHDAAALFGDEPPFVQPHVFSVLQYLDDRSVG